jgi:hypothetical protein
MVARRVVEAPRQHLHERTYINDGRKRQSLRPYTTGTLNCGYCRRLALGIGYRQLDRKDWFIPLREILERGPAFPGRLTPAQLDLTAIMLSGSQVQTQLPRRQGRQNTDRGRD